MTKEQLKRYRALKLELHDINANVGDSTIHDNVKGSQEEFPYILGNRHVVGVPDEDYSLLVRKSDVKSQIKEIEKFVNKIHNYRIKKAIQIYYIDDIESGEDKPTWEDVADEIGGGQSSEAIKKAVTRYLKK